MNTQSNSLNWFEIPAPNLERARNFYEAIFQIEMEVAEMLKMNMAFFPYGIETGKAGGALVQSPMHIPSETGCIIYLNGNPDLQLVLDRIPAAGGEIVMGKTHISDQVGYMAFFKDTEGNAVALHSNK